MGRATPLTSKEYQLNALIQLQEAVIGDMDPAEKKRVEYLLAKSDQSSPVTKNLTKLLQQVKIVPPAQQSITSRIAARIHGLYEKLSSERGTNIVLRWFFAIEAIVFVVGILLVIANIADNAFDPVTGGPTYGIVLAFMELGSAAISAILVLVGVIRLRTSRITGYEWLRRAILVNIFLTEFFMFIRIQFGALPSFAFNLMLFILLRYAIRQERKYQMEAAA